LLFLEYVETRANIGVSNTQAIIQRLINTLTQAYQLGHDTNQILENAIASGWKNIYIPEKKKEVTYPNSGISTRTGVVNNSNIVINQTESGAEDTNNQKVKNYCTYTSKSTTECRYGNF